ncbi:MAG TPA: hypothetical protein VMG10_04815, partial [Gemmataceae bacterium]|nr:hypothetical protein [Gemmataceae bacterium]
PSPKGLCNEIQENGKLVKMDSYPSSLSCQIRQLRCKAALKGWANEKNSRIHARTLIYYFSQ